MDSARAALPELDGMGDHAIAAPKGRKGDFTMLKLRFNLLEFLQEDFFGTDDFGLVRDPCADLGFARSGYEVSERLRGGDFFRNPLDNNLAFQGDPWKEQANLGVGLDMLGFSRLIVGKESESLVVKSF